MNLYKGGKFVNLNSTEKIISTLKKLENTMRDEIFRKRFWFDFPEIPIALYDNEKVFLAGYPKILDGFKKQDSILVGKRDNRFYGNTAIDLEGYQVAIWDLTTIDASISFGKLLSYIFHEAFHGYQKMKGEKRWANELQILEYPFTVENIAIRFLERRELIRALYSDSMEELSERLSKFISLREYRRNIIGDALNYELAQESIEGTAFYIETKVHSDYESIPLKYSIALHGKNMAETNFKLKNFRLSCYAPGMFIAFILDRLDNGWQKKYMNSERYLYDFFKDLASAPKKSFNPEEIPEDVLESSQYAICNYNELIERKFSEFENSSGYRIVLKGTFPLMGMDPMNITWKGLYILNEHIFGTQFNETPLFIKRKSRVRRIEKEFRFDEIVFFSESKPVKIGGFVEIPGIGKLKAKLEEAERKYILYADTKG